MKDLGTELVQVFERVTLTFSVEFVRHGRRVFWLMISDPVTFRVSRLYVQAVPVEAGCLLAADTGHSIDTYLWCR